MFGEYQGKLSLLIALRAPGRMEFFSTLCHEIFIREFRIWQVVVDFFHKVPLK
jgi:hypothetical protein